MENTISCTVHCLCKSTKLHLEKATTHLEACHCDMCRKWGGGPLLGVECPSVAIESEHVTEYASSNWASRGFCKLCGTHLYYKFNAKSHYFIPAGLLDGKASQLTFKEEIFIDQKPHYYDFANRTEKLTKQQTYEKYSK